MSDRKPIMLDLSTLNVAAEVVESTLLAHGIQVVRMEKGGHSVYPTTSMSWIDLYVPGEELARAQAILEKLSHPDQPPPAQLEEDPGDGAQG